MRNVDQVLVMAPQAGVWAKSDSINSTSIGASSQQRSHGHCCFGHDRGHGQTAAIAVMVRDQGTKHNFLARLKDNRASGKVVIVKQPEVALDSPGIS